MKNDANFKEISEGVISPLPTNWIKCNWVKCKNVIEWTVVLKIKTHYVPSFSVNINILIFFGKVTGMLIP